MGKCKQRTKKFFKGLMHVVTPMLLSSGASLATTLATGVAAGALSSHEKRAAMVAHLKAKAKEEGQELSEWAARAINEYIYKTVVVDGVAPEDITDDDDGDLDPEQTPELADA